MRTVPADCPGLVVIEPVVHPDEPGFFRETNRRKWHAEAGIAAEQAFAHGQPLALAARGRALPERELIVSDRYANAPLSRELAGELPLQWHP